MPIIPANNVEVREEGASQGFVRALDFVGASVTATVAGSVATVTVSAGGGSFSATRVVATAAFPASRTQRINILDAAVTSGSKVLPWIAGIADGLPDGGDLVDLETMNAVALAGSFDLNMTFHTPWAGSINVDYAIG